MISKKIIITLLLLVILTTTLGIVVFSYAWYNAEKAANMDFNLLADGFLIINFSEDVDYSDTIITPAIAMPYAERDNLYMDVLRVYDENDPQPSYIQTAAKVATYNALLSYYNEEENSQENELVINIDAVVTLPGDVKVPINLEREISIIINVLIEDSLGEEPPFTIENLAPGDVFTVPQKSIVSLTLDAYIKLPDVLCAPALNEGP
ncbi:MAG TPA: hypothetical protein VJ903_02450, partial [Clostridia bacterium]|nr:hypothetical protein [Clostridia bacterium]